ncbi:MAG: M23 family metallopeptidase [Planctomycetes bacterium]|nr:M23 family metallopeptidase [Planctomycetota bacterium]
MRRHTRFLTLLTGCLALALTTSAALAHSFIYPVAGRITSVFNDPRPGHKHRALDIAGNNGKAIGAARAGRVVWAGWDSGGGGRMVILSHDGGYRSWYAHMSSISVHAGQRVAANQVVGHVGSTGFATGPHLHFAILKNGVHQNFPPFHTGVWVSRGVRIPKDI